MALPGIYTPVVDLVFTLPTTRTDGSSLAPADIASVTVLRNSVELSTTGGPFTSPVKVSDGGVPGVDTYSFYVTDSAGVRSEVSAAVSVTVSTEPPKAPPAVGTLTAVVQGAAKGVDPKPAVAGTPPAAYAPGVVGTEARTPNALTGLPYPSTLGP